MKNSLSVAAALLALTGALAISQDLPSTLPSRNRQSLHGTYMAIPQQPQGHAWQFHIAGKYYCAKITYDEVKAGPDWKPPMPLPLSFSKAEEIARAELKKLVDDSASWEVTDLQLKRIPNEDQPKWFFLIGMEPREGSSRHEHDSFFAVMNLSGAFEKIEELPAAK